MPSIEMPSGLKGEFRGLTLADQDTLAEASHPKTPKKVKDRVVEQMLKNCWVSTEDASIYADLMPNPAILDMDELLSSDRGYYLVKLRNKSWGSVVTVKGNCACGEKFEQGIDLDELPVWPMPESSKVAFVNGTELSFVLPVSGRTVWWRILNGRMENQGAKIIKRSRNTMASEALALRVTRIGGFSDETRLDEETGMDLRDWLRQQEVEDTDALGDAMIEAEGQIETLVDIPCADDDCMREIEVDVKDAMDFFGRSGRRKRRKRLTGSS